jgi:hypothetical protein
MKGSEIFTAQAPRPDVEVDHGELLGAIELRRFADETKTGIVHDVLRLEPVSGE